MKRIDPFTYNLPSLDLHGEYITTIFFLISDFIADNIKLKNNNYSWKGARNFKKRII